MCEFIVRGLEFRTGLNKLSSVFIKNRGRVLGKIFVLCSCAAVLFVGQGARGDSIEDIALFGDSLSNNSADWPTYSSASFLRSAFGGRTLANVAQSLPQELAVIDPSQYDTVLIMAGINDVFGNSDAASLQARVQTISNSVPGDKHLIFSTLPPAGNHLSWNSSRQQVLEDFNSWLRSSSFLVFDLNSELDNDEDGFLDAAWDSGDGLHPSTGAAGGMGFIAQQFDEFRAVPEPSSTIALLWVVIWGAGWRSKTGSRS